MRYRSAYMREETVSNRIRRATAEELKTAIESNRHLHGVVRALGVKPQMHYKRLVLARCEELKIDISSIAPSSHNPDLTGRVFGHLLALRRGATLKCGNTTWVCREMETGIEKPVLTKHLLKGTTKSFSFGHRRGSGHAQWSGHEMISGSYWSCLRHQAAVRRLSFEVTIEQMWNLYVRQGRKCALSGVDIYFGESSNCPYTASLDRIDSSRGYTLDNVQWVHTRINMMKNRFSQEEFIGFCRKVAATHPASAA